MSFITSEKWLAIHLYYNEPWEEFLIKGVQPLIDQIKHRGLADQFFFIRYWEKGPHIRLRFKGDAAVLEDQVKPLVIDYFNEFYSSNPSIREDPEWLKTATEEHLWFPNNSAQVIDYEPEIARYGGEEAITIAEQQFQASSSATLAIIDEGIDSWDYDRALGAAIQLHLGFAYGVGMNKHEAALFFSNVFQNWVPRAYYFFEKDVSKEELQKRRDETLKAFESNFNGQKDTLHPFFQTVWEAFEEGESFDQEWLNQWLVDMKDVKDQLLVVQQQGKLVIPEWYPISESIDVPISNQRLWAIYDSYIHMINNRLGIMNRDEGYLAYLVRESFQFLQSN